MSTPALVLMLVLIAAFAAAGFYFNRKFAARAQQERERAEQESERKKRQAPEAGERSPAKPAERAAEPAKRAVAAASNDETEAIDELVAERLITVRLLAKEEERLKAERIVAERLALAEALNEDDSDHTAVEIALRYEAGQIAAEAVAVAHAEAADRAAQEAQRMDAERIALEDAARVEAVLIAAEEAALAKEVRIANARTEVRS